MARHQITVDEVKEFTIKLEIAGSHGYGESKSLMFFWINGNVHWELWTGRGDNKKVETFTLLDFAVEAYNKA